VRTAVLASDLRRVGSPTNGHGVIIGGGIGGLLAAHALAGRFDRVTILERFRYPPDSISPAPLARRGVPQSRCIHLLMAAGVAAFDKLMPGWSEELIARGAGPFDASADAVLRFPAGWLPRTASGITTCACSRALLEKVLRAGLAGMSTVHVREQQKVLGLVSSPRGDRVTGVYIAEHQAAKGRTLLADLVVDASGEGSTLVRWLSCLPNGARLQADKTVVGSGMQYVSRWFHMKSQDAPNWRCLSIAPTVGVRHRSAMMLRAEEDRWGVVLLAPAGEPLPSDDEAFLDFVAGLGEDELRAALARARPVSPILRYGATSNRTVHYERLTAWPSGLVAIGDSVCTLDPYFGLGMTATARGVVLLRTYLDEGNGEVSIPDFQKGLASLNAQPWRVATGRDPDGRLLTRDKMHLSRLYQSAPSRSEIAHALLGVQHLVRPAETLKEFAV
jgi:2-polyprenyl-6-methoxyphenol hydroxylase-like FAD-dependent oxidoreductase